MPLAQGLVWWLRGQKTDTSVRLLLPQDRQSAPVTMTPPSHPMPRIPKANAGQSTGTMGSARPQGSRVVPFPPPKRARLGDQEQSEMVPAWCGQPRTSIGHGLGISSARKPQATTRQADGGCEGQGGLCKFDEPPRQSAGQDRAQEDCCCLGGGDKSPQKQTQSGQASTGQQPALYQLDYDDDMQDDPGGLRGEGEMD